MPLLKLNRLAQISVILLVAKPNGEMLRSWFEKIGRNFIILTFRRPAKRHAS
jgi:hypothetical protein